MLTPISWTLLDRQMQVTQIESIAQVDAFAWNSVAGEVYPFLRHEFLSALEQSGAVSEATGWIPKHLLVKENDDLLAVMPLYLKFHSRGEFVFDQQWAHAYEQYGLNYYPKWLSAIPFTPCPGPRMAIKEGADPALIAQLMVAYIQELSAQQCISSWHCLFPAPAQMDRLRKLGLSIREGVQFQWFNRGYRDFDDFLQSLNASKRKMLKRERRKVREQGVTLLRLGGHEISDAQWRAFFKFYTMNYLKHGMQPYLNLEFFQRLAQTMGDRLLLVLAIKEHQYVGAALSITGADTLYGRYWGCYEEYNALHFEACYYQGLDYCLEHGLQRFDSGAQGEHKIARGFEPVTTYSAHWLRDQAFAAAVERYLAGERHAMQSYKQNAVGYLPFKQ